MKTRCAQPVALGLAAALLAAGGCLRDPDPNMRSQPKYAPFEPTTFFLDGNSSRRLVEGTVTRQPDANELDEETGERPAVTAELIQRGDGYGNGMVVQRSYPAPPSYHIDRLRTAPDEHFFRVITDGLGKMPPYSPRVRPRDRWAIIAYIRALQLSQSAPIDDVPPAARPLLDQGSAGGQANPAPTAAATQTGGRQ
jgi:hypothetical protein